LRVTEESRDVLLSLEGKGYFATFVGDEMPENYFQ
jgi:hypothetical protein